MNITFDPLNRDERSVVLALLSNLEAPAAPPTEPEKPATKRRKKDETPLPEVAAAIRTVAENVPNPTVPTPPAPIVGPTAAAQQAAASVSTPSIGEQLAQTQALTREDMRDLLSTYAEKGPAEAEFAKSQLKDCMFKLSLLQPDKYPAVAAALAEKGWTLAQAKAHLAAKKQAG